jgi:3D-(3,5/4)-trihydroxycyclohexane-1,2-dione acylhydrolase (decyclizing)
MVGDGSYLMMNSDIYSTVLTGHKMIVVVCDNGGYAVINRLQNFKGTPSFNNLIKDSRVKKPFAVDFAKHAESMGAAVRHCESLADLEGSPHMGQDDGPHHGDLDRHRRLFLGAGRCRLGRGRAGSFRAARGATRRAPTTKIRKKQRIGV